MDIPRAADAPKPQMKRLGIMIAMLGERVAPIDPRANRTNPAFNVGSRPKRSAIDPQINCPPASPKKNDDKISAGAVEFVPRPNASLTSEKVGRTASIDNAVHALRNASKAVSSAVDIPGWRCGVSVVFPELSEGSVAAIMYQRVWPEPPQLA